MSFLLPRFNNSFVYFDLRLGSLIILWISLIWWTLYAIYDYLFFEYDSKEKEPFLMLMRVLILLISLVAAIASGMGVYGDYRKKPGFLVLFIVIYIILTVYFLVSVILIYNVWSTYELDHPENMKEVLRILPFVIQKFPDGIPVGITTEEVKKHYHGLVFINYLFMVALSLITWYFMNVVRNYYLKLRANFREASPNSSRVETGAR